MLNYLSSAIGLDRIKMIITCLIAGAVMSVIAIAWIHMSSLENDLSKAAEKISSLEANNKILQQNVEVMRDNIVKLSQANQDNLLTIERLINERADAQKIINSLSVTSSNDKRTIAALNKKLEEMLKDPKNDGIVSPALRETIRDIQLSRKPK